MNIFNQYSEKIVSLLLSYGPRFLLAIIVLLIGLWIIRLIMRMMSHVSSKRNLDPSLTPFLKTLTGFLLKALLFISVASMIGVATTSFVAIIGAAGLAVGLALQGSLGNFAGGVLILILKPFQVGDYIVSQSMAGTVKEIQIFYTILKTPDNQTVIIPNGQLSNNTVTNITLEATRRLDVPFGISYTDNIGKARSVIKSIIEADERVLKDPAPQIMVTELGDNAVTVNTRVWVTKENYWSLNFDLMEQVKIAFDREGINIPFPQRDVHLYQHQS